MRFLALGLSLALILLMVVGCSDDDPTGPGGATPQDVTEVLEQAGRVEPLDVEKDEVIDTETQEEGDYRYVYETHDVVDNIDSIVYLGLNDDIVWPGNLVRGDQIHDFVYEPINVARAPVTLSISLETSTTGESITRDVPDPRLSTVRQGISNLLKDAIVGDTHVPAKVEFNHQQVYNETHMDLYVGADVSYGAGSLSTSFDWQSDTKKTKIVAKYKQIYYSIDMDTPNHPADLFAESIPIEDLRAAMPRGSMPVYVAGVSYGLMAVITVETDFSYEEMNVALDFAYDGAVDVELESGYTAKEMLQSSNVRVVVYGGSTAGLDQIEHGFEGFMKVVEASREFTSESPGVPLVYRFRHAHDNTLAQVSLTSQYTLVRPVKLRERVRVTVDNFHCAMADDEGAVNTVDMDRFGCKVWAYDCSSDQEPGAPICEGEQVYWWSTGGEHNMNAGDTWDCEGNHSYDVVFDAENFDFSAARLKLEGYARDKDSPGFPLYNDHDQAWGTYEIRGDRFFENGGKHMFLIESGDFRFEVNVTIETTN